MKRTAVQAWQRCLGGLLASVAVAALLSGCGSGNSTPKATKSSPTSASAASGPSTTVHYAASVVAQEYQEAFGEHAYDEHGEYIGSTTEFEPETEAQAAWADLAAEYSTSDRPPVAQEEPATEAPAAEAPAEAPAAEAPAAAPEEPPAAPAEEAPAAPAEEAPAAPAEEAPPA